MSIALVTGSAGLIGSETCKHFHAGGFDVVGMDNDMRAQFFGPGASTRRVSEIASSNSRSCVTRSIVPS